MCTAATYKTKDFYMGRTLDYEFSYGEQITITPRNYEFDFRFAGKIKSHYALIGMAFVAEGYPLYYDAVNEKGLGMAGLNFVGNAAYEEALPEDETEVSQGGVGVVVFLRPPSLCLLVGGGGGGGRKETDRYSIQ